MINKYLISQGVDIRKIDQEEKIASFLAKVGDLSDLDLA